VLAIGGHEVVRLVERLGRADDRGLLADAKMEEAADLRLRIHLARPLFEAADQHHLRENRAAGFLVRKVVLDLPEPDLLGARYLGRGVRPVALLLSSLGVLVFGGSVPGRHCCGLYPVTTGFNLTPRPPCGRLCLVPG
jgi:hypothetical protein